MRVRSWSAKIAARMGGEFNRLECGSWHVSLAHFLKTLGQYTRVKAIPLVTMMPVSPTSSSPSIMSQSVPGLTDN